MNKIKILFPLVFILSCMASWAQNSGLTTYQTDSIFSLAGKFKRTKISLGTDTLFEFIQNNSERKLNAKNIRTIEKVFIKNREYYKVITQNIPANISDITIVSALLDYSDLHLITMQLSAKSDSGIVEFKQNRFSGWSQLPKEERKVIDLQYDGLPVLADAGTPWIVGLLSLEGYKKIAVPYFALFSNIVKWKTYEILSKERVSANEKMYLCWKVNAGHVGPPGYTSYQWYDSKTGKFIKSELIKEGSDIRYVSELKRTNNLRSR